LWNPDVVVRIDCTVEVGMGKEFDVCDLRKTANEITDSISLANSGRVQRYVEHESARTRERGGISAGLVVLFNNKRFESLPRKGHSAAQSAESGADDDGIKIVSATN
jgi:hypothetical protein